MKITRKKCVSPKTENDKNLGKSSGPSIFPHVHLWQNVTPEHDCDLVKTLSISYMELCWRLPHYTFPTPPSSVPWSGTSPGNQRDHWILQTLEYIHHTHRYAVFSFHTFLHSMHFPFLLIHKCFLCLGSSHQTSTLKYLPSQNKTKPPL